MINKLKTLDDIHVGDIVTFKSVFYLNDVYVGDEYENRSEKIEVKFKVLEIKKENNFILIENMFEFDVDKINENLERTSFVLYMICNHSIFPTNLELGYFEMGIENIFIVSQDDFNEYDNDFVMTYDDQFTIELKKLIRTVYIFKSYKKQDFESKLKRLEQKIDELNSYGEEFKKSSIYRDQYKSISKLMNRIKLSLEKYNYKAIVNVQDKLKNLITRYENLTGINEMVKYNKYFEGEETILYCSKLHPESPTRRDRYIYDWFVGDFYD